MFDDFLKEKGISREEFAKKSPEERNVLHNEYTSKNIAEFKDAIKDSVKQEDIDKAVKAFEDAQEKQLEGFVPSKDFESVKEEVQKLAKSLEEANKEILALTETGGPSEETTFKGAVAKALTENFDALQEFFEENKKVGKGNFEIQIKAPATVTTANILPNDAAGVYAAQTVSGYSEYLYGYIYLEQFLNVGSTNLASFPFADEIPGEGDAAIVAEGALKPLIDVDYVTAFSQAEKIAGAMKATEEVLSDYGWMQSAMEKTLKKKHDIARQSDVLTKALALATPFNAAILGGVTVTAPQYYDAIAALVAGMANDSKGHYVPNVIFVNTLDNLKKKLTKDADENYVMPPFADAQGNIIDGVKIVANPEVTVDTFVVGDMKNIQIRNVWGYTVRFGWENDDFRRNMITMIGESRYHVYATTNDRRGVITGTFTDLITALTPV